MKKGWKIGISILILFILFISTFFIYKRVVLDKYEMNGNTLVFKNNVYARNDALTTNDEENLGKTIGIALEKEKTVTDYIFPFWVIEYKNDKEHNRIFVRGLMGSGGVYNKNSN